MGVSLGRNLIASLNGKKFSVDRGITGTYIDGYFVEGSSEVVEVLATNVPLSPKDIKDLPEGVRSSEARKLFSADLLQVVDEVSKRKADVVTIDGRRFRVDSVNEWPNYWEAVCILENVPDTPQQGV